MDASSALSDDLSDYDIISNSSQRSIESSIADLGQRTASEVYEPSPSQVARDKFETAKLTIDDIQTYVSRALGTSQPNSKSTPGKLSLENKTVRVYVDGIFDAFNAGHALQLRQAKLSFPSVNLMVGVFSDDLCRIHGFPVLLPHVERCEVVRHCRWVDEVLSDAPWQVDEELLRRERIDYVTVDEGTSVDPGCDKVRLKGYDLMKKLGKVIPTRRTTGLTSTPAAATPITPVKTSLQISAPYSPQYLIGY